MSSRELQPGPDAPLAPACPAARMLDAVRAVWDEGHRDLARYAVPEEVTAARERVAAMADVLRRAVRDRADRLYAQNLLAALRLRQERWLGRWLAAHVNHSGGGDRRSRGRNGTAARDLPGGVTKNQSAAFQRLAAVPDAVFDRYLSDAHDKKEEITTAGALRFSARTPAHGRPRAAPGPGRVVADLGRLVHGGTRFGTVYADPPWEYANTATRGAAANHYPTLSVDELATLPVGELAAADAHLHLWTTNAFLFDCPRLLAAWGFEYKGVFVWVKPQVGLGNYWRVAHEFLVLGVRGQCPFRDRAARSWAEFGRGRHSEKPDEVRALIERVSPGPYLELFARRPAPGWVAWGDEVAPPQPGGVLVTVPQAGEPAG